MFISLASVPRQDCLVLPARAALIFDFYPSLVLQPFSNFLSYQCPLNKFLFLLKLAKLFLLLTNDKS